VNAVLCQLAQLIYWAIWIYSILLFVYAVLSWIPDLRGRWSVYLAILVEPVLAPFRRIIPPAGGIDWSFLVVIIILQILLRVVARFEFNLCLLS
jgi:YggT family protein